MYREKNHNSEHMCYMKQKEILNTKIDTYVFKV